MPLSAVCDVTCKFFAFLLYLDSGREFVINNLDYLVCLIMWHEP